MPDLDNSQDDGRLSPAGTELPGFGVSQARVVQAVDFYRGLEARFAASDIDAFLTSGQACIRYKLYDFSKDSDWVVRPESAERFLAVLADTPSPEGTGCVYAGKISAPLDKRWLSGGWSSHLLYPEPDGAPPSVRIDIFTDPPRVAASVKDPQVGVMAKGPLACIKKTQRDKDWPMVHDLAMRMLSEGDQEAFLHLQHASNLRDAAANLGKPSGEILSKRPLLRMIGKASDDELDELIYQERRFWQMADKFRVRLLVSALRPYAKAIGELRSDLFSLPLMEQHQQLVSVAGRFLPEKPLEDAGGESELYRRTQQYLLEHGTPSTCFPGPPPINRFA